MCRLANFLFSILISFGAGTLQEQHQTDRRHNTTVLSCQRVEPVRRRTGSGHPRPDIPGQGHGHNFSHRDLPRPAAVTPRLPI
ncbi:hypothetical protein E2C01_018520 [Portunus trituberculatus]|uniref:Secreted protein n=1 Tax=Portunus trituberculatus TaxID=210409 RepID=A0A5B7DWE1_PORTR|nr:hypothetical protein [Portunus trituberculatus]